MAIGNIIQRAIGVVPATLLCLWVPACSTGQTPMSDADVARLVPVGASLVKGDYGDADGDGNADILIVVERGAGDGSNARGILIFRRESNGSISAAVDSPAAIPCRNCGGMMGDPLQSVSMDGGSVSLRLEGGSRELWSSDYRFDYVPALKQWVLVGIVHSGLDRTTGQSTERRLGRDELGHVPLEIFDPADYPADALP